MTTVLYPPQSAVPDATRLSEWSMVLGIVSFFVGGALLGIPALVCGLIARKRINDGAIGNRGQTTAGIALGSVTSVLTIVFVVVIVLTTPPSPTP